MYYDLTEYELLQLAFNDMTDGVAEELTRRGYTLINGEWD